ncbi:MAG: hypothetical protein M3319_12720, partial [Actinomycetota bacterium]|nr:hypothetical protein [Actinomycetota bacterium]
MRAGTGTARTTVSITGHHPLLNTQCLSQRAIAWLRHTAHPPQSDAPHARTGTVDDQPRTIGRGDRCVPELPNSTAELTSTGFTTLVSNSAHSARRCHAGDPLRRVAGGGQGPSC